MDTTTIDQLGDIIVVCTILIMFALGWIAGGFR
jgi:hypothetical protein